jgi:hypothetical protein
MNRGRGRQKCRETDRQGRGADPCAGRDEEASGQDGSRPRTADPSAGSTRFRRFIDAISTPDRVF